MSEVAQSWAGSIVDGGKTSATRIDGSATIAAAKSRMPLASRLSAIIALLMAMLAWYSWRVADLLRLKKESDLEAKACGSLFTA